MVYVFLLLGTFLFSAQPQAEWEDVIDKGADEKLYGMEINKGNLYLTGGDLGEDSSFIVLKLDSSGSEKLYKLYWESGIGYEVGQDLAVFPSGNIVVTGWYKALTYPAWYTLWIDSTGERLYDDSMPLDPSGWNYKTSSVVPTAGEQCFVGGWFGREDQQGMRVEKFDSLGERLWRHFVYGNDYDRKLKLTLDFSGSVYALSETRCTWCGWYSDGNTSGFQNEYLQDSAQGSAIRINPANHVFIAGDVDGSDRDFMLLKYKTNGDKIWSKHKAYDLGADEECTDMALDRTGGPSDCYLAGYSVSGVNENTALVKTDSAGNLLWSWVDTVSSKREIEAIEVDNLGYVYLAGSAHNGTDWDMLVMKLRQPLTISGTVTDSAGTPMGGVSLVLTGDTSVEAQTDEEGFYTIEVYNGGEYTVKPEHPGWSFEPPSRTYSPLAHRETGQDFGNGTGVVESPSHSAFDLEVESKTIRYSISRRSFLKIGIYDVSGSLVNTLADGLFEPGTYEAGYDTGLASGVYFVRFDAGVISRSVKLVITR